MTTNTRIYKLKENTRKIRLLKINFIEAWECLLAFLLNKICILSALSPFGISYFAATYPNQRTSFSIITAFIGILLSGFGVMSLKYIGSLTMFLILTLLFGKAISEKKLFAAFCASVSLFMVGMVFVISDGFLLYDVMLLSLEAIISFFAVLIFQNASMLLRSIKEMRKFLSGEILTVVFLLSAAVYSIVSIPRGEAFGHFICIYAILFIAYVKGFELSCCVGIITGAVFASVSVLPQQVFITYILSSLAAGIGKIRGKAGVSICFISANILSSFFLNSLSVSLLPIICTLLSSALLFLTPSSAFAFFGEIKQISQKNTNYILENIYRKIALEKINSLAEAFSETSEVFSALITQQTKEKITNPGLVFDAVAEDVCRNCSNSIKCWETAHKKTAQELSYMFDSMSERGYAVEFDASCKFRENCIHFDEFLSSVNNNYKLHKNNLMWASKVHESRCLIPEQFNSISSALKNISRAVEKRIEYDSALTKKLVYALEKRNYGLIDVRVIFDDCCKITVVLKETVNKKHTDIIASVASGICEVPLFCFSKECKNNNIYLKFMERTNYATNIGYAEISASGKQKCGDSHIFSSLEGGKYLLALSDGMGSGDAARAQSKTTVELIKMLLDCGFDKETALKLINTILLLKSPAETFATADICILNSFSGAVEFIKSGASSSYIKHAESVAQIGCNTLPIGTIADSQPSCELMYVKDGDYIVMLTDGISDILDNDGEFCIKNIIFNFNGNSPQELAEAIINVAKDKAGTNPHDDMTVMVAAVKSEM